MKVKVDKWVAVACWSWDISDSQCTICQEPFEKPCPKCKFAGDDCSILQGQCGHYFHMHCIYNWLQEKNYCPLDRIEWNEKKFAVEE
jgi:anaphase-promoting complex subunit 11